MVKKLTDLIYLTKIEECVDEMLNSIDFSEESLKKGKGKLKSILINYIEDFFCMQGLTVRKMEIKLEWK